MHLKSILIFFLVCFLTDTMSEGLNAIQIQCFLKLVKSLRHYNTEAVNKVLKYFRINEEYKYNCEDKTYVRAFEILKFVVQFNKLCDNKQLENLSIEEVELISTEFNKLADNEKLIDGDQYVYLISIIGKDVGCENKLNDWSEKIKSRYYFEFGDVLLDALRYRAQIKKTIIGEIENLNENFIYYIVNDHSTDEINEKCPWLLK
ncbi:uncharacterized protein LOC126906133 [Daktulosphaira vitifoliae]|uniref:uncharacterized protein LOC126906133 n=1 Tax=Daktulosphaira vitifoliae TaxID=58002 RepID=UPI0021AAAF16|nr:uncharacterized protein LOC126906133 [Daktulosphaira vitifoliae]XP_050542394.1 uncharacterized protein LOC126906133 [Daktulosphaira vitifoliae]